MPQLTKKSLRLDVSNSTGEVSALFYSPAKPMCVMIFAHGAGAGMKHQFMEEVSARLGEHGIATLRFNFPFMEKGKRTPDPKPICFAAINAAVEKASEL